MAEPWQGSSCVLNTKQARRVPGPPHHWQIGPAAQLTTHYNAMTTPFQKILTLFRYFFVFLFQLDIILKSKQKKNNW